MAKGSLERGRLRAGKRLTIAEALGMAGDGNDGSDGRVGIGTINKEVGFAGYLCHAFRTAAERLEQKEYHKIGNGGLLVSVELEAGKTEAALKLPAARKLVNESGYWLTIGPSDEIATVLAKNFGKNSRGSVKKTRDSTDLRSALEKINTAARAHGERLAVYAVSIGKEDGGTKWYLDVAVGGPDSVWREMGPGLG